MRNIDVQTWPRREHFKVFSAFDQPHFNMCANVDLSTFFPVVKQRDLSFTVALVYVLTRASNTIPEFRHRIRAGKVVEHEIVHPSGTILVDEDLFSFCTLEYYEDFSEFAPRAAERIAFVKEHPTLKDEPGRDDLLFMTAIPWVSFTSFMHPMHLSPADSVPRFAWGKVFKDGEFLKMPLDVQAHHALMDGVHVGRYYAEVQDYFDHPDFFLGEA
ncbi:MAG TPA: chloramphenicol acetyltransferase [Anaerolineae bacterium]|nr:chloramphenicol acetyltransferase [Anaerolineae bacterium]